MSVDKVKAIRNWLDRRYKKVQELREEGKMDKIEVRVKFYVNTLDGVEQILKLGKVMGAKKK